MVRTLARGTPTGTNYFAMTPLGVVQLQFAGLGLYADSVEAWLDTHYPHLAAQCDPGLHLTVTLHVPPAHGAGTWHGQLLDATAGLDLALEVMLECSRELRLPSGQVLAVHVTG